MGIYYAVRRFVPTVPLLPGGARGVFSRVRWIFFSLSFALFDSVVVVKFPSATSSAVVAAFGVLLL